MIKGIIGLLSIAFVVWLFFGTDGQNSLQNSGNSGSTLKINVPSDGALFISMKEHRKTNVVSFRSILEGLALLVRHMLSE